jgi:hypothetical protein
LASCPQVRFNPQALVRLFCLPKQTAIAEPIDKKLFIWPLQDNGEKVEIDRFGTSPLDRVKKTTR